MPTTRSINDLYYISDGIDSGAEAWGQTLQGAHANPAHSALRRVRHFEEARTNVERLVGKDRLSASNDFGFFTQRYLMSQARRRQMWSVR